MRYTLRDTSLLWLLSLIGIGVQTARALGATMAVPRWTGLHRMLEHPWEAPALLALAAVTTLVLAYAPVEPRRRARAVGWAIGLLGIASYIAVDAPLAVVLIGTGRMIHGPRASAPTDRAPAPESLGRPDNT